MKSLTIVIPVIYVQKRKHTIWGNYLFSILHKVGLFKSFKWTCFSNNVFKRLKQLEGLPNNLRWKKVSYKKTVGEDCLTVKEAFEVENGFAQLEEIEREYYYKEMFDTMYDKKGMASHLFMLTKENGSENQVVLVGKEDDLDVIKITYDGKERLVRKAYYYLTNTDVGLLIIETDSTETGFPENSYSKLKVGEKSLINYFLGNNVTNENKKILALPYNDKCYFATYECANGSEDILLSVTPFQMHGRGDKTDMGTFFSHYFQIFWLCILQKTEILHVSQMAGRISRNKSSHKMRDEIQHVNEEYALFSNQYDLVECTYDEKGEKLYALLRDKMRINLNKQEVGNQMKILKDHAELISGKWNSFLLLVVSVLGSFASIAKIIAESGSDIWTLMVTHWTCIKTILIICGIVLIAWIVVSFIKYNLED